MNLNPLHCCLIPKDYARQGEFKKFSVIVSNLGVANHSVCHHIFLELMVELAYASDRHRVGCLPKADFALWFNSIDQVAIEIDQARDALLESKIIRSEDDYFFCLLFFEHNRHFSYELRTPIGDSAAMLGRQRKKFERSAVVTAAAISPNRFQEVDGERITLAEMRTITVMVNMIDSILGRPERKAEEFTPGLVHDACQIFRKHGSKNLEIIMARLLDKRESGIPRTTDRLLAQFDFCLKLVEPHEGWGEWSLIQRESQKINQNSPSRDPLGKGDD